MDSTSGSASRDTPLISRHWLLIGFYVLGAIILGIIPFASLRGVEYSGFPLGAFHPFMVLYIVGESVVIFVLFSSLCRYVLRRHEITARTFYFVYIGVGLASPFVISDVVGGVLTIVRQATKDPWALIHITNVAIIVVAIILLWFFLRALRYGGWGIQPAVVVITMLLLPWASFGFFEKVGSISNNILYSIGHRRESSSRQLITITDARFNPIDIDSSTRRARAIELQVTVQVPVEDTYFFDIQFCSGQSSVNGNDLTYAMESTYLGFNLQDDSISIPIHRPHRYFSDGRGYAYNQIASNEQTLTIKKELQIPREAILDSSKPFYLMARLVATRAHAPQNALVVKPLPPTDVQYQPCAEEEIDFTDPTFGVAQLSDSRLSSPRYKFNDFYYSYNGQDVVVVGTQCATDQCKNDFGLLSTLSLCDQLDQYSTEANLCYHRAAIENRNATICDKTFQSYRPYTPQDCVIEIEKLSQVR